MKKIALLMAALVATGSSQVLAQYSKNATIYSCNGRENSQLYSTFRDLRDCSAGTRGQTSLQVTFTTGASQLQQNSTQQIDTNERYIVTVQNGQYMVAGRVLADWPIQAVNIYGLRDNGETARAYNYGSGISTAYQILNSLGAQNNGVQVSLDQKYNLTVIGWNSRYTQNMEDTNPNDPTVYGHAKITINGQAFPAPRQTR